MTATARPAVQQLASVGLHVLDTERSLAFYRDLLGLVVLGDSGWLSDPDILALHATPDAMIRIVTIAPSGRDDASSIITLVEMRDIERGAIGGAFQDPGTIHLHFVVSDLDNALATLMAAGYPPLAEPREIRGHNGRLLVAFVRDPDGFNVELAMAAGERA